MPAEKPRGERILRSGSAVLGFALLLFGLVDFFYGLLLFGDRARYMGPPYLSPFAEDLAYVPEVVIVSAAATFVLGIWLLQYSQAGKGRPPPSTTRGASKMRGSP